MRACLLARLVIIRPPWQGSQLFSYANSELNSLLDLAVKKLSFLQQMLFPAFPVILYLCTEFMKTVKGAPMPQIIKIQDLHSPALELYAHLNENQLKHYFEPLPEGIFIAESPTAIERAMSAGYEILSLLLEEKYVDTQAQPILESCRQIEERSGRGRVIPVYVSTIDVLSKITGYHLTRGILGAFRRKRPLPVSEVCRNARRIAVLDNIENPTNVGAIFRSAAALGMDAVLVTPASADPLQRRAIRVSVGTVFQIPWTYIGDVLTPAHRKALGSEAAASGETGSPDHHLPWPDQGIAELSQLGFYTVAMALRHDTLPVDSPKLLEKEKIAVILGNEGSGLPEHTIALCDATVKIPMSHGVDSLNVAAASAVMFWVLTHPA